MRLTLNQARRRGAAMIETVLVLPIILLVLSLLFLFGLNFMRLTGATEASRYAAWRAAEHAPGPDGDGDFNNTFFRGEAGAVSVEIGTGFPDDARDVLHDAIEEADVPTVTTYAENWLDAFPTGVVASVTATHDSDIPLWRRFNGTITQRETRIGNEWKYVNRVLDLQRDPDTVWWFDDASQQWIGGGPPRLGQTELLRDAFYETFDQRMEPIAGSGNVAASTIRGYYLWLPTYCGPNTGIVD